MKLTLEDIEKIKIKIKTKKLKIIEFENKDSFLSKIKHSESECEIYDTTIKSASIRSRGLRIICINFANDILELQELLRSNEI